MGELTGEPGYAISHAVAGFVSVFDVLPGKAWLGRTRWWNVDDHDRIRHRHKNAVHADGVVKSMVEPIGIEPTTSRVRF